MNSPQERTEFEKEKSLETDYVIDRRDYPRVGILGRVIFGYSPKYSGILMGIDEVINENVGSMIAGGILYLLGSVINRLVNDADEGDNFKTLEKRLKQTQQNETN